MAFTFKLRGKPITLSHLEDVVALRPAESLLTLTAAKIFKTFRTAVAKDDSHGEVLGIKLPARGRKIFEKAGWLFCQSEKSLWRSALNRIRPAGTEAVMLVFVDRGGNTLIGTNLVVVQLPEDLSESRAVARLKEANLTLVRRLQFGKNLFEAKLPARKPFDEAVAELQESKSFVFAEPSMMRALTGRLTPSDTGFAQQWQHRNINSEAAWDHALGTGVKIALIDNGMQVTHPDLIAGIDPSGYFESDGMGNASFVRYVPGSSSGSSFPDRAHGTFCLGMAGARINGEGVCGSAPESRLIPIGCLNDQVGTQATLARAVAFAANPSLEDSTASPGDGADILACSLGPSSGSDWLLSSVLDLALQHAAANGRGGLGMPIFWAVSNGPDDLSGDQIVSHPDVIAVGRSNESDEADGSAFGPKLDFLAPGKSVFSTTSGDDYSTGTGTSFACPLAAGVAALVLSTPGNSGFTRDQVLQRLRDSCDPVGGVIYDSNGHNDHYGHGRINAEKAVT